MSAIIIAGLAVILVAAFIIPLVSRGQRYHWPRPHEPVITRHLAAEAERLALYGPDWPGAWPADLCAYPPCSPEDGWVCESHRHSNPDTGGRPHIYVKWDHCDQCYATFERTDYVRRTGRHAAVWQGPLDDQPAEVILAVVTDVQKRRQP